MQILERTIESEDVSSLSKAFFNVQPTEGQQQIIKSVIFPEKRRTCITAFTRYGKTWSLALASALFLLLNENVSINAIAPVQRQTKKYREYLVDFILASPRLSNDLDVNASSMERIRKEVSQTRMTFRDGSEVKFLTAGGSNMAQSLMGHGADLVIVDESCDISDEIFRKRITRMRGDSTSSIQVEIGNPWKKNHFYEHFQSPEFTSIRIPWTQGVREGRVDRAFIEEQRRELTELEFKVLYEAQFPETVQGGLFKHSWIDRAAERQDFDFDDDVKIAGLDVAEFGNDRSVLTTVYRQGRRVNVDTMVELPEMETMATADEVEKRLTGNEYLCVDAIGLGAGVASRLKQKGFNVYSVNVGRSTPSKRFRNLKAKYYWRLRNLFEDDRISLNEPPRELVRDLMGIRYEHGSSGIHITDPEKSPDYGDSLMLACSATNAVNARASVPVF